MSNQIWDDLSLFLRTEFSFEALCPWHVFLYIVISLILLRLVRLTGHRVLFDYSLEPYTDSSEEVAFSNVAYRIVAPVLLSSLMVGLLMMICNAMNQGAAFECRWLPIAIYWGILLLLKLARRTFPNGGGFFLQILSSLALAMIFDVAVFERMMREGFSVLDESAVGFQMLLAASFSIVYAVTSMLSRSRGNGTRNADVSDKMEKRLYSYHRKYESAIRESLSIDRCSDDYLFRSLLFTIMFIEDKNRPWLIRLFENMISCLGLKCTTGIMQCKMLSDGKRSRFYSDEESVRISTPIIEKIYRDYIVNSILSDPTLSTYHPVWFTNEWVLFPTAPLEHRIASAFDQLYGCYRGSSSLSCSTLFLQVLQFEKGVQQNNYPSHLVIKTGSFSKFADLFPGAVCEWQGGRFRQYGPEDLEEGTGVLWQIGEHNMGDLESIAKKTCSEFSICSIETMQLSTKIIYKGHFDGVSLLQNRWYLYERL